MEARRYNDISLADDIFNIKCGRIGFIFVIQGVGKWIEDSKIVLNISIFFWAL